MNPCRMANVVSFCMANGTEYILGAGQWVQGVYAVETVSLVTGSKVLCGLPTRPQMSKALLALSTNREGVGKIEN